MSSALESKLADPLTDFGDSLKRVHAYLDRLSRLNALYRAGNIHAHVPDALHEDGGTLDEVVGQYLPASHSALQAASQGLFFSLPVAFDPSESVGPYLAAVDRDAAGQPYRFLDMGAQIATHAFGENDPDIVRAVLESLPFVDRPLRPLRVSDDAVAAAEGGAQRRGARRHAAPLHREHGRRGRRERDQVRADEPRDDDREIATAGSSSRSRARSTDARSAASPSRTARRRGSVFRRSTGRTFRSRSTSRDRRRRRCGAKTGR